MELPLYLLDFEAASDMAGWSYERKGKELRSRLKGKALLAVQHVQDGGLGLDYNSLTEALFAEFLPSAATISANMQLNSCTQGDMSVREYGDYLRRLAMVAYPPGSEGGDAKNRDRRALDRFMVTLNVGDVRVKVLEAKPTTLRRAMNVATEYLAILGNPGQDGSRLVTTVGGSLVVESRPRARSKMTKSAGAHPSVAPIQQGRGEEGQYDSLLEVLKQLTAVLARMEPGQHARAPRGHATRHGAGSGERGLSGASPLEHFKCFKCGKFGHLRRDCTGAVHCVSASCKRTTAAACCCIPCDCPAEPVCYSQYPN